MRQLLHVEQACRDACALAGAVRQRADLGRCPARTSSCAFSSIMATSVLGRCRAMVMQRCGARAWLSAHVPKNGGDAPSVAAAPEKAPDSDSGNASETGPSSIGAGETASSDGMPGRFPASVRTNVPISLAAEELFRDGGPSRLERGAGVPPDR